MKDPEKTPEKDRSLISRIGFLLGGGSSLSLEFYQTEKGEVKMRTVHDYSLSQLFEELFGGK